MPNRRGAQPTRLGFSFSPFPVPCSLFPPYPPYPPTRPTRLYTTVTPTALSRRYTRDSVTHPWQSGAVADTRPGDFWAVPERAALPDFAGACPCTRAQESHASHSIVRAPCLLPHAVAGAHRTCCTGDRTDRRSYRRSGTGSADRRRPGAGHRHRHPHGLRHRWPLHPAERAGRPGLDHRAHARVRAQDGDGTGGYLEGRGRAEHLARRHRWCSWRKSR